jgi:membrane-bound inhibitor of C-type lysozyme
MDMKRREFITLLGGAAVTLISQLPVFAQPFLTYHCHDGSEFIVAFYEGDKRAHMQLDGKAITLPKRISLSGSRYAKGDITLRITKTATILKREKHSTDCTAE